MEDEEQLDITKLKYALYVRKSTDDPQRQVRSVDDQIAECEIIAKRLGIKVIKPYLIEKKSAKTPGRRAVFNTLISDLKKGKYDGILSWHPDRLARNMREGGEIIDMIDTETIKDLKFVTHHFTPDANGKMLLGMSFVLSKQYSDDLSQKVGRGMKRSFKEGKSSGTPKHGYIRTEEGIYKPDGLNFELICDAWQMRKEKSSLKDIVQYVNDRGYQRIIKSNKAKRQGQIIKMTEQILSNVFKDSFYYGLLMQANQQVDLRTLVAFKPAVTEEDYNLVQLISGRSNIAANKRKSFYPLRGMVLCAFCRKPMYAGASSGTTKRYLNYRCDNKTCTRKKRSIRAKVIFNYLYKLLDKGLNFTDEEYASYLQHMTTLSDNDRISIRTQIRSREGALKALQSKIRDKAAKIIDYDKKTVIWQTNNRLLEEWEQDASDLRDKIDELKSKLTSPEDDILSLEQFLNLSKDTAAKLKAADEYAKDRICRILFLNFVVDEQKVVSHTWKEPYATYYNNQFILTGRGDRT